MALAIILGAGSYYYLFEFNASPLDPKQALQALATLRQMPSRTEGVSIDERMNQVLKESREAGRLVRYQGWTVAPAGGNKKKLLIVFSFEEKESGEQRAEWVADTTNNTFVAQTKLASSVYPE